MDDQLVPAIEAQNDELEQTARTVEAQAELAAWAVLVEVTYEDRISGRADRVVRLNSVFEGRRVNPHET